MKKAIFMAIPAVLVILLVQCTKSTEPEPAPGPPQQRTPADLTAAEKALVNATNGFSLELFREILALEPEKQNVFTSPLSVSYALGMTYNGASGQTRLDMADVLGYGGLTGKEINESYKGLMSVLGELDPDVVFRIANSIWYRLGKPVREEFIDITRTYFDALVREMDWSMPGAADTINAWIEEHTNGKITNIISPPISEDIAMFLINAIYFNGAWTVAFDPESTVTGSFFLSDDSTVGCDMMRRADTIGYFYNDLFQAAELPYGDGSFSMIILLPLWEKTVDDIVAELTPGNWAAWTGQLGDCEIPFSMPKFKFDYGTRLDFVLKQMGMAIAWDPYARGFCNMFADSIGWIDEVRHKAFVQVDENGTEAAAVTVVLMADSIMSSMTVNRPFLFVIHERESGTILFMGRVAEPVWE